MPDAHVVVFVSQRNSFRSVLARACLEHVSKGRFKAYSCGNPARLASEPHELALYAIRAAGIPLRQDTQYDWNEFARLGVRKVQFVITMDETIQDLTPKWSGQPDTALWAYPDLVGGGNRYPRPAAGSQCDAVVAAPPLGDSVQPATGPRGSHGPAPRCQGSGLPRLMPFRATPLAAAYSILQHWESPFHSTDSQHGFRLA